MLNALTQYLELIVEPTFDEFRRNANSSRHAYLACVATYHAIDRVTYPEDPAELRKEWRKSLPFLIVDMIAHHVKHAESSDEIGPTLDGNIPLPTMVFGTGAESTAGSRRPTLTEGGIALHNLLYVVRDAIRFVKAPN